MYNIILDRLPTEYNGYLIRTSFRIGMQICMCMRDNELSEDEKLATALDLLYGNGIPDDIEDAIAGLNWFISCGEIQKQSGSSKELFYWDFDASRIYSSFMVSYGIDITKEDMHWFKFISLIGSLTKDCAFNQAVGIRSYDMSDLKGKARNEMMKMKQSLQPNPVYTDEEKEAMDKFDSLLNGGDVNG